MEACTQCACTCGWWLQVEAHTVAGVLALVERERGGEAVNRPLLKSLCRMFSNLGARHRVGADAWGQSACRRPWRAGLCLWSAWGRGCCSHHTNSFEDTLRQLSCVNSACPALYLQHM